MKKDEKSKKDVEALKTENRINVIGEIINSELQNNDYTQKIKELIVLDIKSIIESGLKNLEYDVLFLYDINHSISQFTSDKIYQDINKSKKGPILLIIHSNGGEIEPAYLISKTCNEYSSKFAVAIPRRAKSAATLISLGAEEIHMGSMSELGPIDPQINGIPALALRSALESLSRIVEVHPKTSEMYAKYLTEQLRLVQLGYLERISESAMQYASRLLGNRTYPKSIEEIAKNFVYEYKDHSFVVDKDEAKKFLGDSVKVNTDEYTMANLLHERLNIYSLALKLARKKTLRIIGSVDNLELCDIPQNE